MRTQISTFTFQGQDIDILYHKGELSYIFDYKGKRYGNKVKAQGKSVQAIMAATMCLLINYVETREAADKNDSK